MSKYECKPCKYTTTRKSNYTSHLGTRRHKENTNPSANAKNTVTKTKAPKSPTRDELVVKKKRLEGLLFDKDTEKELLKLNKILYSEISEKGIKGLFAGDKVEPTDYKDLSKLKKGILAAFMS
jgi:hypothetical protein